MGDTMTIYFAKERDLSEETFVSIRDFVNEAFEKGEAGMWKGVLKRTSVEELRKKAKEEQLVVAEKGGKIIGIIVVHGSKHEKTAAFGMLAVHSQYVKKGVGRQLVDYAENWAVSKGMTKMKLELLTPSEWKQPTKEFLKNWYRSLGYLPQRNIPFEKDFPHLTPSLETACVFTEWEKRLD